MADPAQVMRAHVVQELCFEVEFETQDQAWQQQERVTQFAQGQALHIVQDCFDEAMGNAQVLHLDRLELDLGWMASDELEAQWAQRLRQCLQEQLQGLLVAQRASAQGHGSDPALPVVHWRSPAQADLHALLHFLQHGHMPWQHALGDDPIGLAERVWQNSPVALLSGLRALPEAHPSVERMASQLPAAWLRRMVSFATPSEAAASWPADPVAAQARLRAALAPPEASPAPTARSPSFGLRAYQRRFKALLVDDAPTLSEADLTELHSLWPHMLQGDRESLRQQLHSLGTRAGVRRRIARLWPESLLQQLPSLWWPATEAAQCLEWVKDTPAPANWFARRQRWLAVLSHLWVGGGGPVFDRAGAFALLPGEQTRATDSSSNPVGETTPRATAGYAPVNALVNAPVNAPSQTLPVVGEAAPLRMARSAMELIQQLQPLAQQDPAATRATLCTWASTWARQLVLAAVTERNHLEAWAACWLTAGDTRGQARDLAALAFAPLPQPWLEACKAQNTPPPGAAQRVQSCLQRWVAQGSAAVAATELVTQWWRELAVQLQCSPASLRQMLHSADRSAAHSEKALHTSWLRWLPATAHLGNPSSIELLRLQAALAHNDGAAVAATLQALLDHHAAGLRAQLPQLCAPLSVRRRLAQHVPRAMWPRVLGLFVPLDVAQALLSKPESGPETLAQALATAWWGHNGAARPANQALTPAQQPWPLQPVQQVLSAPWWTDAEPFWQALLANSNAAALPERLAHAATALSQALQSMGGQAPVQHKGSDASDAPDAPHVAWQRLRAAPLAVAQEALVQVAESPQARATLLARLDNTQWRELLAIFLPSPHLEIVQQALSSLQTDARALPGRDALPMRLRETALTTLAWLPNANSHHVLAALLEQVARQLGLPVPALARRLDTRTPTGKPLLWAAWSAALAPLDLDRINPRSPTTTARDSPQKVAAVPAEPPTTRAAPVQGREQALATVVAHLRRDDTSTETALASLRQLLALDPGSAEPARTALARELESASAARRLVQLLDSSVSGPLLCPGLLPLLCWLRPADATSLHQAWPTLQALVSAGSSISDHPRNALSRWLLRELIEEDRPWLPDTWLPRAQAALRGSQEGQAEPSHQMNTDMSAQNPQDLFITNAGVVLAAPYLPLLFERLGLVVDRAFIDDHAAQRAAMLIQYAVSGQTQAPESLLMLNKLLCGLALHTPLRRELELLPQECQAVDGMLGAIIAHWKALGSTSLAGLRQTFMQREGHLQHREDTWQLQVQVQTFDVLLDRLPWGFSTIKFPWMSEVLHVHWK